MKNYYEILEVDKNASDEIIKAAYKSLVKKYHPDLQQGVEKSKSEEKIKAINDAYDVLSDSIKRDNYNQTLISENISKQQYEAIVNENAFLKQELNRYMNSFNIRNPYSRPQNNSYNNNTRQQNNRYSTYKQHNYTNQQNQQYNNTTNNSGFKNFFNNIGEKFKTLIAIGLTGLILFIVFNIPFINELFYNFFGGRISFLYRFCNYILSLLF